MSVMPRVPRVRTTHESPCTSPSPVHGTVPGILSAGCFFTSRTGERENTTPRSARQQPGAGPESPSRHHLLRCLRSLPCHAVVLTKADRCGVWSIHLTRHNLPRTTSGSAIRRLTSNTLLVIREHLQGVSTHQFQNLTVDLGQFDIHCEGLKSIFMSSSYPGSVSLSGSVSISIIPNASRCGQRRVSGSVVRVPRTHRRSGEPGPGNAHTEAPCRACTGSCPHVELRSFEPDPDPDPDFDPDEYRAAVIAGGATARSCLHP